MEISTPSIALPGPSSARGALGFVAASAVVWALAATLLYLLMPDLETFPRLLVFSECVGLTMATSAVLLLRQRRLARLSTATRWLLTGVIAIPTGYLLGHQIAFLLLGEPLRMVGYHRVSVGPLLLTVLVGGLGLRYFAVREQLAREAATRAEAQRLVVEAQLRLLRTQIEPHMLFNTLATLRGLVREDVDRAETMIDRLIVFLRGTLTASQTESVPLAREFAQLRAYLEIMSLRMGPRLGWRLELPAALEAWPVPAMLLQPLVENAIKHGLEPKVGPGRIEVVARRNGAGLEISVEDDGLGLPDADPTSPQDPAGGYGLRHVRERLHAAFGSEAGLSVAPLQPRGVRSTVRLPSDTRLKESP